MQSAYDGRSSPIPPPPPPRPWGAGQGHLRRPPPQPPSISTSFTPGIQAAPPTPASAISPFSPIAVTPGARGNAAARNMHSARAPSGHIAAYNPQEWSHSMGAAASHSPQSPAVARRHVPSGPVTGMEGTSTACIDLRDHLPSDTASIPSSILCGCVCVPCVLSL